MTTIKIKVLSEHAYETNHAYAIKVLTERSEVMEIFLTEEKLARYDQANFYKLMGCNSFINGSTNKPALKLTPKTRVLCNAPFTFSKEVEDKFYHADEMSVVEAVQLPKNSRVTIRGVVESVSPLKEAPTWTLKTVNIRNATKNKSVAVNLWGNTSQQQVPPVGSTVTVESLETSTYREDVVCFATQETAFLTTLLPATTKTINITAFEEESDNMTIFDDDDLEYVVPKEMLESFNVTDGARIIFW